MNTKDKNPTMSDFKAAEARYRSKFPDADVGDWIHPSFMFDPRVIELVDQAVQRGKPVDRSEAEKVFGPTAWEW
jgi:hypothetical protein